MPSLLERVADKFFVSVVGILVFVLEDDDEEENNTAEPNPTTGSTRTE
jgi:hypothetical protein